MEDKHCSSVDDTTNSRILMRHSPRNVEKKKQSYRHGSTIFSEMVDPVVEEILRKKFITNHKTGMVYFVKRALPCANPLFVCEVRQQGVHSSSSHESAKNLCVLKIEANDPEDCPRGEYAGKHENLIHSYLCSEDYRTYDGFRQIIPHHAGFLHHTRQVIVMEYCPKGDLLTYIKEFKNNLIPMASMKEFFRDITRGLAYMHKLGVSHRDLKLENVLMRFDKELGRTVAVLCDFGFSTHVSKLAQLKNKSCIWDTEKSGVVVKIRESCGSLQYASPQIIKNEFYNAFQDDIWSLGVLFYCMLNGFQPFAPGAEQLAEELQRTTIQLTAENIVYCCTQPHLKERADDVSVDLFDSMVRVSPEDRPTCEQILLHQFFDERHSTSSYSSVREVLSSDKVCTSPSTKHKSKRVNKNVGQVFSREVKTKKEKKSSVVSSLKKLMK